MVFPLMALGAGLGQFAQQYQQQQAQAERSMMLKMQLANMQREMEDRARERNSASMLFGGLTGGLGDAGGSPQMKPIQSPFGGGMPSAPAGGGGRDLSPLDAVPGLADAYSRRQQGGGGFGAAGEYGVGQFQPQSGVPSNPVRWAQSGPGLGPGEGGNFATGPEEARLLAGAREPNYANMPPPSTRGPRPAVTPDAGGTTAPEQTAQPDQMAQYAQVADKQAAGMAQTAGQGLDPSLYGRMSLQALARQIEKNYPGADPVTKMMALEKAQKLLAPDQQYQFKLYQMENQAALKQQMMEQAHQFQMQMKDQAQAAALDKAKEGGWDVLTDPTSGVQYRYNKRTGVAKNLVGDEDYVPSGAARIAGGGGSQLTADRAKDLAAETKRLDEKWMADNPTATDAQKQAAHFKNRAEAEKVLANAKASDTRQSPRTMIFRKAVEEHPEFTPEEMSTYLNNMDLNSKITATFAGGESAKQMRAINTVADHVLRVQDYAEALGNGQLPRANEVANRVAKELGRPEVTTFEAGRDIMADEIVRLLTSTGGTEKDREGMQSRISAMMSPEQFAGVFQAFRDFSGARFEALKQQFTHGDPKREAQFGQFLTPAAKKVFEGMQPPKSLGRETPPATASPATASPAPGGSVALPANAAASPPVPPKLAGKKLQWSPSRQQFRDESGQLYDKDGNPAQAQ